MAARRCQQCGATVELPDDVFSTRCAFCDSPLVEVDEEQEPVDQVAPFDVPRERAGALLKGYLQESWMAPEMVRKAARPDELRPVLVPFYVYDAVARTQFSARVGIYWHRTETYTTTVNGKTVVRTRQVRETDWHPFQGSHARKWFDHLVSASKGLPESEANDLEPFDLGRALAYTPALTAGLEAEYPTIEHAQAKRTAAAELASLEKEAIASGHLPGDTHSNLQSETAVEIDVIRLVLLPIWISAFPGPKGPIRLLVNGQTGEVVGSVPRSYWKVGCIVFVAVAIFVATAIFATGVLSVGAVVSR